MRKFWLGYLMFPPEVGAGSGSGSTENGGAPGNDASVTSGSASESLIAAALASESSSGGTGTESEAAQVAKATGLDLSGESGAKPAGATGQQPPETGQAPQSRIESAVKNARAAAVTETEAKYAWAKDLNQETVKTAFDVTRALLTDAPKFLRTLAAQEGYQVVKIGEALPAATKVVEHKAFSLPTAELRSEDGKGAYSEAQMATILKDFAADLEHKFGGQLKPLLTAREEEQRTAAATAVREEARQTVVETMTELRGKPFFQVKDTSGKLVDSPKIMEYLLAIPEAQRVRNPIAAIHRAYNTYMEKDILPNYGKISEQSVREENARKAAAGGGARPGAGPGAGSTNDKPLKGVSDLAASMERAYAAAAASGA